MKKKSNNTHLWILVPLLFIQILRIGLKIYIKQKEVNSPPPTIGIPTIPNVIPSPENNEETCPHIPYGVPKGTPETNDFICREIYALSSNDETKFADWVAYKLTPDMFSECQSKMYKTWLADWEIAASETLEPEDYHGAAEALETDGGHLAPPENFRCTFYSLQTNYLSNRTPQKSELERGSWKELEIYERALAREYKKIYLITGPTYETVMPVLLPEADESHTIPAGYFKIFILPSEIKAYHMPHNFSGSLQEAEVELEKIEQLTQLKFPVRPLNEIPAESPNSEPVF